MRAPPEQARITPDSVRVAGSCSVAASRDAPGPLTLHVDARRGYNWAQLAAKPRAALARRIPRAAPAPPSADSLLSAPRPRRRRMGAGVQRWRGGRRARRRTPAGLLRRSRWRCMLTTRVVCVAMRAGVSGIARLEHRNAVRDDTWTRDAVSVR